MKQEKKLIKRTILFLLISSLSLLTAALIQTDGEWWNKVVPIVGAACFWLFLVAGYLSFWQLSKCRKRREKRNRSVTKGRPGIIRFFSNRYATVADIVMIAAIVINVALQFVPLYEVIWLFFLAVFLFSAQMHCILNGINFHYILQTGKSNPAKAE